MPRVKYLSDAIQWDINELTSRIIAESGIPTDRFHLGKILLQTFKDYPNMTLQKASQRTKLINTYGQTEVTSMVFLHHFSSTPESCGKPIGIFQYRLVNIDTGKDINEPNIPGELWLKGPAVFKGYYNNPKATAEVFAEGYWYKTGDIFYRDEHWNYYYMERMKLLLKNKCDKIFPAEVEDVIRQHPGVSDVAVIGVPDPEGGDLLVACIVLRPGHSPTAQEIKDLVKESLVDTKQLRGGVVFMDTLPTTKTGKIYRNKLNGLIPQMKRE